MIIVYKAMTLQTANHLPKPKEVFGNPVMTNHQTWYMEQYQKCICMKTNSFHKEGDVFLSRYSYRINEKTLKISIDGGDYTPVQIEQYIK